MRRRLSSGLTLVEVLIVIGIIGMLVAISIPAVMQSREAGRRITCTNNQHNLATAILAYENRVGEFPGYRNLMAVDASGAPRSAAWMFAILSDLERTDVYRNHGRSGPDATRGTPVNLYLDTLVCPSDSLARNLADADVRAMNSYVVNAGQRDVPATAATPADWLDNGVFQNLFPYNSSGSRVAVARISLEYLRAGDGLSNTLMLSENVNASSWINDDERNVGFVWDPVVTTGGAWPSTLNRINQGHIDTDLVAHAPGLRLADFMVLGCWGCGGPPLIPPRPLPPRPTPPPPPTAPTPAPDPTPGSDPLPAPVPVPPVLVATPGGNLARPSSYHAGGVVATFADGSSKFLSEDISYTVYCQLMSTRGQNAAYPGLVSGTRLLVDSALRTTPLNQGSY